MRLLKSCVIFSLFLVLLTARFAATQGSPGAEEQKPAVTSLDFDPPQPDAGQPVQVKVGWNQYTSYVQVIWKVNGQEVGRSNVDETTGRSSRLDKPIKADDKIEVIATPMGIGGGIGAPLTKTVTCRNAPPTIRVTNQRVEGNVYKAVIEAKDPDGDQVTLTLAGAPQGMQMDSKGNITWNVGDKTQGSFEVKVSAKDSKGAEAVLSFPVIIKRSR